MLMLANKFGHVAGDKLEVAAEKFERGIASYVIRGSHIDSLCATGRMERTYAFRVCDELTHMNCRTCEGHGLSHMG